MDQYPGKSGDEHECRNGNQLAIDMNNNPLNKGIISENFIGVGTVSPEMVRARAAELAVINGRSAQGMSSADWDEAKRELTGGQEMDPRQTSQESLPEEERWDPVPGSTGFQVPVSLPEDDDDEGRSEGAQLVEQGVAEAEHDQMLQSARKTTKEDLR